MTLVPLEVFCVSHGSLCVTTADYEWIIYAGRSPCPLRQIGIHRLIGKVSPLPQRPQQLASSGKLRSLYAAPCNIKEERKHG